MSTQDPAKVGELLSRTAITLGMHHAELAKHLGVSRRSISRWTKDGTFLGREAVVILAELALTRDRALAAELAALAGETLVSLGLEAPPAGPATQARSRLGTELAESRLVDLVVYAAAERMDTSPRAVRPAFLAAFQRARELGVTLEALEAILTAEQKGQNG